LIERLCPIVSEAAPLGQKLDALLARCGELLDQPGVDSPAARGQVYLLAGGPFAESIGLVQRALPPALV
jgi:hypothetical protein